jgi:hypothetical protein
VRPKAGRIVAWSAHATVLFRPPSVSVNRYALLPLFLACPAASLVDRPIQHEILQATVDHLWASLPRAASLSPLDMPAFVSAIHHNARGDAIAVFDHLFDATELEVLRKIVMRSARFSVDEPPEPDDVEADGVITIELLEARKLVDTSVWAKLKQAVDFLTPQSPQTWHPYDVACNLLRFGDHPRVHEDADQPDDEWTLLMCVHPLQSCLRSLASPVQLSKSRQRNNLARRYGFL